MADKEVSGLTAAATLDGTELVHVVQGGNSRQSTTGDVAKVAHTQAFSTITGTPTTLAGYGITDAQAKSANLAAIAALSPSAKTVIVGDGTAWTAESGATFRASVGLAIGSDVQAYDADLTTLGGLSKAGGNVIIGNGTAWTVESGATLRSSFGLSIGSDVQAYSATLASLAGLTLADGDILYSTGASALAKLSKGSGGQVLMMDAGLPSWANVAGTGDMVAAVYDPNSVGADAFSMDSMVEGSDAKIMTAAERTKLASAGDMLAANNLSDLNSADAALTNLGATTVGKTLVKSATASAASRIVVGDTHIDLVARYGVIGGSDSGDSAKIQSAFDNEPVGCTLHFPPNYVMKTTVPLVLNKFMNLDLGGCSLRGDLTNPGHDILRISTLNTGNWGSARSMLIEGGRVFNNGGGNCAINVNPLGNDTEAPQFELEIRNGLYSGYLKCIRFGGTGAAGDTNFNTVRNCNLATDATAGVAAVDLDGCADGHRILDNLIFGKGTGVKVNPVLGAFNTLIAGNGIVTQNGAVLVTNGSRVLIYNNQIEQNGANGLIPSAHILVQGLSRISRGIIIKGNNFGGGSNVSTSIFLYNARGTVIDENQFYPCSAQDIAFGSDSGLIAHYNTIGPNNWFRGTRSLQTGLTDTTRRMIISEAAACVGNRGFWKPLPTLQNGWTAGTGCQYMVDSMGDLKFKGTLTGGTLTAGTLISVLPAGARPQVLTYFPVGSAGATFAAMQLGTTGSLSVHGAVAMPNATVNLGSVSIPVEWLDTYEVGE